MGKTAEKTKKIDKYSFRPVLSFGKDGKVYSRLDLLLTFLSIVIIGGLAIWLSFRAFGRQTPSVIQYDLPPKEFNPKIPWNTDDFKFALTLGFGTEEDNRLVSYAPYFIDGHTYTEIPITVNDCDFGESTGTPYKCFSQPEDTKDKTYLDTMGYWGYMIDFGYCYNTEIDYDCYSQEEIKRQMIDYSYRFFFFYEDLLIDPFNYETPMAKTPTMYTDLVMLAVSRTVIVELNEIEFITDSGWLFEDLKTETKLKASISTRVGYRDFLNFGFKYGGTKTVYKRTYPKIQDFLAQISGLVTLITPIFILLVSPYGNLKATQHLVNEIYEIKLNNNESNPPQKHAAAAAKKRRSSKSKAHSLQTTNPTLPKGTEGDLLPQNIKAKAKRKSKTPVPLPPINLTKFNFAPHAALAIGAVGTFPVKEEETPPIPEENILPFNFELLEKSPSSPFKLDSVTSRYGDENNLISPQKSPREDENIEEEKKETENKNPVEESESEEEEEEVLVRTSDPLKVPLKSWLKSFWKPTPEVQVLNKAKKHIMETFDLVTLSKKVIEIDKLKACLLTYDQRVIFENLPSSVIELDPDIDLTSPEAIKQYHWKDYFKGDETALRKAYSRLRGTENQLDQLLIKMYESEYIG